MYSFSKFKVLVMRFRLDSRSFGALAGLAVAVIFTWRLLRSSGHHERRQPKRQPHVPSSSSTIPHLNSASTSSGECRSLDDLKLQNVEDDFSSQIKTSLGEIVRHKLRDGRRVTCRLLGVILEEFSPEELQKKVTVRPSVLPVLLEITKFCDVYLMERVLDDETEDRVISALEGAGVFRHDKLIKEKVLFCSTENGRSSFVRQLEPDWHIDTNKDIIFQLARFVRYQLCICETRPEQGVSAAANVFTSPSLEHFFG